MPSALPTGNSLPAKWEQIMDEHAVLCRHDVIWLLEYVKHKLASRAPELLKLPPSRLLANFHAFAEIAMLLIHGQHVKDMETDRIKHWIREAACGLCHNETAK